MIATTTGGQRVGWSLPCLLLLLGVWKAEGDHQKIVDLSQNVYEGIPYHPNVVKYQRNITYKGLKDGYWYQIDSISGSTHTATHVDAPCHFHEGGKCISDIPVQKFIAPGVVVDVSAKAEKDPDYSLTVDDMKNWEEKFGRIPDGSILLVATGWDRYWGDPLKYLGTLEKDESKLHFPGVSHEAAQWLADNRKIVGIGLDTISLDAGQVSKPKSHTILSAADVYFLENLKALTSLPPTGFTIYSMPMKLDGTSGAPARVVAIVGDDHYHHNPSVSSRTVSWCVSWLFLVWISLITLT